jgi:uncharacterized protein YjbI with pentapeptide repeats
VTLPSVPAVFGAVHPYWQVLTRPARWLLGLQAVLVSHSLLTVHAPAPSAYAVESLTLVQFLVVWCAWCEQLFSLRRCFQATETQHPSLWRRLTLDLYGGFLFMAVLSLLVTVHPLLGIGAMFLLFTSVEALDVCLSHRSIAGALAGGMSRSYRLISAEPWRFLARLLIPGLVLYAGGTLVVGVHRWAAEQAPPGLRILGWWLAALALMLWLAFFALAQLQLQVRSMAIDVDDLPTGENAARPATPVRPQLDPERLIRLRLLAGRFGAVSGWAATAIGVVMGLWLVFQLGRNGLLNMAALVEAFQGMVGFVTSTVQAFLDLLLKLGFLAVVVGAVACGVVVLIGLGRRRLLSLLRGLAQAMRNSIGGVGEFLAKDLRLSGATLGIGTLLTALGTIAVQTYARVQEGQLQQRQEQQTLELRLKEDQAFAQELNSRMDGLEKALNDRVAAFLPLHKKATPDQRALMVSDLRELLPQLRRADGGVDGVRKGAILRHLYESGLLLPSDPGLCSSKIDDNSPLFAQLGGMSQLDAEATIRSNFPGCLPGVFLDSMEFSGANLSGAFLKKSFLPFINLSHADLRGAQLQGANLKHARLESADLSGADLSGADLRGAVVVGSDLTDVKLDCDTQLDRLVAFYAHFPAETREAARTSVGECADNSPLRQSLVISWDLLKGPLPLTRGGKEQARWTFCPLDPENDPIQNLIQAGAKCANRRFNGGGQSGSLLQSHPLVHRDQNWSGGHFSNSHFEHLTLRNVALVGAALDNALFRNVRLENVDFSGANLQGATFSDATLEGVDFSGADLRKLRFERVRARNVRLQGIVVDRTLNLGTYNEALQRQGAFSSDDFGSHIQDELATFRQDLLAPILFGPLPLRPLHLLYWMLPNALPQRFPTPPGTAP